jgi:hypothetical protein
MTTDTSPILLDSSPPENCGVSPTRSTIIHVIQGLCVRCGITVSSQHDTSVLSTYRRNLIFPYWEHLGYEFCER